MRIVIAAASALALVSLAAPVAVAAKADAAVAKAPKYTTAETDIGTLLDDPAAKAIIEKHIPGLTSNAQIEMARGLTLRAIQVYAAGDVTDDRLAAIDADLAKLGA